MAFSVRLQLVVAVTIGLLTVAFSESALALDTAAARQLARKESCLRCHALSKKKEGPSYESVAYKYKNEPDAADTLIKHITSGEKVKLSDGHLEDHKITKTKDPEQIRNLIAWILSR